MWNYACSLFPRCPFLCSGFSERYLTTALSYEDSYAHISRFFKDSPQYLTSTMNPDFPFAVSIVGVLERYKALDFL